MKKIFYICWMLMFVFSCFVLINGKIKPLGRYFLNNEHTDTNFPGDLYAFAKLDEFKDSIVIKKDEEHDSPDNADIICFGDSFFRTTLDSYTFATELEKRSPYTVYNVKEVNPAQYKSNPLIYLNKKRYKKSRRKILILESCEYYSLKRGLRYPQLNVTAKPRTLKNIKDFFFLNTDVEYFFKENILIYPLYKFNKMINYTLFGEMDSMIGRYSIAPKMLFYKESAEFYETKKKPEQIKKMGNNITFLADMLLEKYNIVVVYLIMPNKISIYNDFLNQEYRYDNYIQNVYNELEKHHIHYINIYARYMSYRKHDDSKLLYYRNDSHYTFLGKKILIKETIAYLKKKKLLQK